MHCFRPSIAYSISNSTDEKFVTIVNPLPWSYRLYLSIRLHDNHEHRLSKFQAAHCICVNIALCSISAARKMRNFHSSATSPLCSWNSNSFSHEPIYFNRTGKFISREICVWSHSSTTGLLLTRRPSISATRSFYSTFARQHVPIQNVKQRC